MLDIRCHISIFPLMDNALTPAQLRTILANVEGGRRFTVTSITVHPHSGTATCDSNVSGYNRTQMMVDADGKIVYTVA